MSTASTYPETVEANIYWNLLSGVNDVVKVQLFRKLKQALTAHPDITEVHDEVGQAAYYELIKKFHLIAIRRRLVEIAKKRMTSVLLVSR